MGRGEGVGAAGLGLSCHSALRRSSFGSCWWPSLLLGWQPRVGRVQEQLDCAHLLCSQWKVNQVPSCGWRAGPVGRKEEGGGQLALLQGWCLPAVRRAPPG